MKYKLEIVDQLKFMGEELLILEGFLRFLIFFILKPLIYFLLRKILICIN